MMKIRYLIASIAVSAVASVNAATPLDYGEMQPGVVYEYQDMVPVMGYYTPSESGVMRTYSTGEEISVYEDAAHENEIASSQSYYSADGEKVRIYSVMAGKPVYFYNAFPIAGGKFRFTVGKEEIKLSTMSPAIGNTPVSLSVNYDATAVFSIPVKCTKCTIEVNGEKAEITPGVIDSTISVNWFNTLREWYRAGKINGGDVLTLTITGIRDVNDSSNRPNFGDGAGKLVVRYIMAPRPVELIREIGTPASGMTDFLTYYLPGSDEGKVSLIFSGDLDPNCHPDAQLTYGDADNIEVGMYFEHPPVLIDGNMLTVDLQGVSRFPDQMIPGLPAQNNIDLVVSKIRSADGQYVLTGQMANPYSFGYSYRLKSMVYSIAADWVPVAGSALEEGSEMEIWVLNGHKIIFDSVDFTYMKNGVPAVMSVPYSALTVEKDEYYDDALLFYLKAPAIDADPDSEITVAFGGLKCADGLDHSSDIFVRYKSAVSGVSAVEAVDGDAVLYDLTGRRVASPSKGIYIRDGKKIIVK
ncbi:MAG: hypothetical protein K2N09_01990 [Muribaculaceae bacterium]|nr:hypothetical protein [Muribaculaceae bacterium]